MRTPRKKFVKVIACSRLLLLREPVLTRWPPPAMWPATCHATCMTRSQSLHSIPHLLSAAQDSLYGLNVTNRKGDVWWAHGDKRYLDDSNARAREIVEVLRLGASTCNTAYDHGACMQACVQAAVDEANPSVFNLSALQQLTLTTAQRGQVSAVLQDGLHGNQMLPSPERFAAAECVPTVLEGEGNTVPMFKWDEKRPPTKCHCRMMHMHL